MYLSLGRQPLTAEEVSEEAQLHHEEHPNEHGETQAGVYILSSKGHGGRVEIRVLNHMYNKKENAKRKKEIGTGGEGGGGRKMI